MKIGIAGAGLVGRLLALACLQRGWDVTLFDADDDRGYSSCGWMAAGMIAPYTELEACEPLLLQLGLKSLAIWPQILQMLVEPVLLQRTGTLVIAHPQDASELIRFQNILSHKNITMGHDQPLQKITREKIEILAPDLSSTIQSGLYLPTEGYINNLQFFSATTATLRTLGVTWLEQVMVQSVQPHVIVTQDKRYDYDWVCDCRGLGAKPEWSGLRGVRGELIWLETKAVRFDCSIRLLHPRYPIYLVPRPNHGFVVGATMIESEDRSPIALESMLELLSAAYTIHPGFAQARVIQSLTQCRPAFADQLPKIAYQPGLLKVNGLYRHGYTVGPALIEEAVNLLEKGKIALTFPELMMDIEESLLCKS